MSTYPDKIRTYLMKHDRNTWRPVQPISAGATAYHNAVINTSWHKDNIHHLIQILRREIKKGHRVVDFGAGTGASSLLFLEHINHHASLWLVDNSASWLGKAFEQLQHHPTVKFFHLQKTPSGYQTLSDVIGSLSADHVFSANTVHLIPNLKETFSGIYSALKPGGSFTLQSGSIIRKGRKKGILMIDDTVNRVHDIAMTMIKTNPLFTVYRKGLDRKIQQEEAQRKFVFPPHRSVDIYLKELKKAGFRNITVSYKRIRVQYKDWLDFLRVRRLQAGIVPEIGGKAPTPGQERDRDKLITLAARELFNELKNKNPFADETSFTTEWIYVTSHKA